MSLSRISSISHAACLGKYIISYTPPSTFYLSSSTNATLIGSGTYKLYKFLTSGSIEMDGSGTIYYVIIGGGASGGGTGSGIRTTVNSNDKKAGGGGGGGCVISGIINQTTTTTYTITVGSGGAAPRSSTWGNPGTASQISYNSTIITALPGDTTHSSPGGLTNVNTLGLTGVAGITESGYSSSGCDGGTSSNGKSVMTKTGYKFSMTSPAFTGLYASGGGGGNCNSRNLNNTYGAGEGGTFNVLSAKSAIENTGSGGGGERSYSTGLKGNSTACGGSGIVLFFFEINKL